MINGLKMGFITQSLSLALVEVTKEDAVNIGLAQISKQIRADLELAQNRSNSVTVQDGTERSKTSLSSQTKVKVNEELEDVRLIVSVERKKKVFVLMAYDLILENLKQQVGLKRAQIAYLTLASQAAALSQDWSKEQIKSAFKEMRVAKSTIRKQSPDRGDSFKMHLHAVEQKVDAALNCLDVGIVKSVLSTMQWGECCLKKRLCFLPILDTSKRTVM